MFPLPFTMGELASWRYHIELLMFKSHTNKTVGLFWLSIPRITLIAGTLPYSNSSNMATDALPLEVGGGDEGPAWDCCNAPAWNIPRNFLDLAFERRFLPLAWWESTPAGPGTLFLARYRKSPFWRMRKILHYQQWCFSRIRQEKFQGNPGNLLVFFTVYAPLLKPKNSKLDTF